MPGTNEAAAEHRRGIEAADALERHLPALDIPVGHRLDFDRKDELSWFCGQAMGSVSAYLRRNPSDPEDPAQYSAEIRIHVGAPKECRAIVFAKRGSVFWGRNTDLLQGSNRRFISGSSFDDVARQAVNLLNDVLSDSPSPAAASVT